VEDRRVSLMVLRNNHRQLGYRGLARDIAAMLEGFFSRRAGRINGNNVRKRPKIGHISETFQCIKSNRNFNVKVWKVFIYLHLDFLGN
jgi:hypothetical protein